MTPVQMQTSPRVWFLTGCSSGFGRLFVSAILARSDKVIATARDISTLSDFAHNENVHLMSLDITAPQDVLNDASAEAVGVFGQIDVLVNNAGYVLSGVWEETSQSQILHQFNTNIFGPLNLTRALLPHMRSRRTGTIIFLGSIAGWLGVAVGGPYSASKFALEGSVESLQKEVALFGIDVHLAVLGQFRTSILASNRSKSDRAVDSISDYDAAVEGFRARLERTNDKQPGDPVQAVERIMDAVCRTGHFAGQQSVPFRIVLGSDALEIIRDQCQGMLRDLEGQEGLARSTDFPGGGEIERYE